MLAWILNVALGAGYFIGSWARRSGRDLPATPGQRLLRIAVGQAGASRPITLAQATARWLLLMGPVSLCALLGIVAPASRAPVALVSLAWYLIRRRGTPVQPDDDAVERFVKSIRRPRHET